MKDGTDGDTLAFKLKVVRIGQDEYGEEETSCVIEHVDAAPEVPRVSRQKPSAKEAVLFDVLKTVAPSGTVNKDDLITGYQRKMPKDDDNKRPRRDAMRALEGLIAKRLAFMHENDRVSLTSLVVAGNDEDWLK
jgi:hypothetical protein